MIVRAMNKLRNKLNKIHRRSNQFYNYKSMLKIINDQLQQKQQLSKGIRHWLQNQLRQIEAKSQTINNKNTIKHNSNLSINELIQKILQPDKLRKLLLKVNYNYFSKTEIMDYQCKIGNKSDKKCQAVQKIMSVIQKYINYTQRSRYAKRYRQYIIAGISLNNYNNVQSNMQQQQIVMRQQQQISSGILKQLPLSSSSSISISVQIMTSIMIRLLLYICTRSENNQQFISRIISLSQQEQVELKEDIDWVTEELLEEITEKEELIMRFNQLQQTNSVLSKDLVNIGNNRSKLQHRLNRTVKSKSIIQHRIKQNYQEKLYVCQQISHANPANTYATIFRQHSDRNALLHLLLQQKQKKHEQLITKNKEINQQLDSFQEVLQELVKEKKQVKRIMNEKENQSFRLEMRASLQNSDFNDWGYGSKRSNRRSKDILKSMNINNLNNKMLVSKNRRMSLRTSVNPHTYQQEMHESMNMLSKIQQLKGQKQALVKQLQSLKRQGKKLKQKQVRQQKTFSQLSELYSQCLKECGIISTDENLKLNEITNLQDCSNSNGNKLLKKQRSKTLLTKVNSKRYLD